jgi:hypothetical protein
LQDPNATIGQTEGFSEKDILRLEKMYEIYDDEDSSYASRPQYITSIIITLYILTHLV